jgi:peptidoglycan/xylan/chitin deacetylase (PgdA/CDA1 family)
MKLRRMLLYTIPSIIRHLVSRNYQLYERILRHLSTREDIWIVPQGEYISWWKERENATLRVWVSEGSCHVHTSLENGVIERFPGEFLDSPTVPCKETEFSGEVWITLNNDLEKKDLLIEILKREGIPNLRIADEGEFMLSQEDVGPILGGVDGKLRRVESFEAIVRAIRQVVIDKLAARGLSLFRIWYHPRVDGIVIQAVFSPRFDVDRAITNLPRIRALEREYDVSSTVYIRVFCPFYTDRDIQTLASMPGCPEIALHGEFVSHARKCGDESRAAGAEKAHLEKLIGRPVLGVAMHGGELAYNKSENTDDAIQRAGFLYDTTNWVHYYFPFKEIVNGQFSQFYSLPHSFSDFSLLPFKFTRKVVNGQVQKSYSLVHILRTINTPDVWDYKRLAYEKAIAKMNEVRRQNGVLVVTLHPIYFGFFSYFSRPKNWILLAKFLPSYLKRSLS